MALRMRTMVTQQILHVAFVVGASKGSNPHHYQLLHQHQRNHNLKCHHCSHPDNYHCSQPLLKCHLNSHPDNNHCSQPSLKCHHNSHLCQHSHPDNNHCSQPLLKCHLNSHLYQHSQQQNLSSREEH